MRALVLALVLSACSSSKAPSTTNPPPATTNPPPASSGETACSSDADCVVVETACCEHCNGGKAVAFNKAFADQHKPTGCENTTCTKMACGAATASCDAGTCKVTISDVP